MRETAGVLLGSHDFRSFGSPDPGRHGVRDLRRVVIREMAPWLIVSLAANAFLKGMARTLAAQLLAVGRGEQTPGDIESRLRRGTGVWPARPSRQTGCTWPEWITESVQFLSSGFLARNSRNSELETGDLETSMKTFVTKPKEVQRAWLLIDAAGKPGRPRCGRSRPPAARQAQADLFAQRGRG